MRSGVVDIICIGFRDVFIAATTMVIYSRLVSLNRKHFERDKGLKLV